MRGEIPGAYEFTPRQRGVLAWGQWRFLAALAFLNHVCERLGLQRQVPLKHSPRLLLSRATKQACGRGTSRTLLNGKRNLCKQSYAEASQRMTVTINWNRVRGTCDMGGSGGRWGRGEASVAPHPSLSDPGVPAHNPACNPPEPRPLLLPNLSPQHRALRGVRFTAHDLLFLMLVDLYLT